MESMSKEQKARMATIPFGHLLSLPHIKQNRPLLDTLHFFWMMTIRDLDLIKLLFFLSELALPSFLVWRSQVTRLNFIAERVFSRTLLFFNGDYKNTIRNLVKNKLISFVRKFGLQDTKNFTKCQVYFFITIVFPTVYYYVSKALYQYLDDLDRLGSYSWDLAISTFL